MVLRQPGGLGGALQVMGQRGPAGRGDAAGGRLGQHAGTVPAPVAKAHLALAPQHAADGHQGLRAQIFSQYAPDHPAVPEQKRLPGGRRK